MPRKQDLGASLEKLAKAIVDEALKEGTPMLVRNDILKTVGAFWLGQTKIKAKPAEEETEPAPSFGRFRELINGATENG